MAMTMVMQGSLAEYPGPPDEAQLSKDLKKIPAGLSIGTECFTSAQLYKSTILCASKNSFCISLSKKDFAEVVYFRRMEDQALWTSFLENVKLMEAMPYYLAHDMCKLMFEQVYKKGEIVYDVDDSHCDCLYFVREGSLQVEAQLSIDISECHPVS